MDIVKLTTTVSRVGQSLRIWRTKQKVRWKKVENLLRGKELKAWMEEEERWRIGKELKAWSEKKRGQNELK